MTATPTSCRCLDETMHKRYAAQGRCAFEYSDVPPPPLIRQHNTVNIGQTLDPQREKEFKHRFKHYGCTVKLLNGANRRWSSWLVEDVKTGARQETSFDSDMQTLLRRLAEGHKLEHISLIPCNVAPTVVTSTDGKGPHCAVCDCAGGLPCPTMLKQAIRDGLKLALTPKQMEANSYHVHPGRCRKRLRQLLDAGAQARASAGAG